MADILHRALGYAEDRLTPDRFKPGQGPVGQSPSAQSLGSYLSSTAQSFDPRHPSGAFNLATILVPGARKGGGPTPAQWNLLQRIYNSSRMQPGETPGSPIPVGAQRSPSAMHLGLLTGEPEMVPARVGLNTTGYEAADNPLASLIRSQSGGAASLGLRSDRGFPPEYLHRLLRGGQTFPYGSSSTLTNELLGAALRRRN